MNRERFAPCGVVLIGLLAAGCSGNPEPSLVPPQTVEMDAETLEKLREEVQEYVELRRKVLAHITPVTPKATSEELVAHQRAFTQAIVAYRKGKKRGNIFKSRVEAAIRRTLTREFSGPDGPVLMKAIRQGNPKVDGHPNPQNPSKDVMHTVKVAVNAVYTDGAPLSSVPPSLLQKLPLLPDEVRYRFVGRALILRDTEANVILDYIMDVVPDRSTPR